MLEKAAVEFTKEEAQLIANLLPNVPLQNVTIGNAQNAMRVALQVEGILQKIQAAFAPKAAEEAKK